MHRAASVAVVWCATLALALCSGLGAAAEETGGENAPAGVPPALAEIAWEGLHTASVVAAVSQAATRERPRGGDPVSRAGSVTAEPAAATGAERPIEARAADRKPDVQLAQFQLPRAPTPGEPSQRYPERPVIQHLTYQYSIGSESEVTYRRDPDLNKRVRDNSLIVLPQVNGLIIYRPSSWLVTTLEMIADKEIALNEESAILLPNGETQYAQKHRPSLLVDQAFVAVRGSNDVPFEIGGGRRNYEDERHWLYDTSMDVGSVGLRRGPFRAEVLGGRQVRWDMDLLQAEVKDRIDTYMLYVDYRGIEDLKLAGHVMRRNDRALKEGNPLHFGVGAQGIPSNSFNYWAQLGYVGGRDEANRRFSAYGFDVGGTYRFRELPLSPSITLGYAFGTGDGNPDDNRNREFRQTGLQSNEVRLGGVSKFKYYGETVDSELSNLKIVTVGFGFRPAATVTVDLVYHRYRLHRIADEIRGWALTAQMNQDDTQLSRDMGSAFDVVVGIRNLFGVRRLGVDLRAGWFFPGKAFRIEEGDPADPTFRKADKGISLVAKFWY